MRCAVLGTLVGLMLADGSAIALPNIHSADAQSGGHFILIQGSAGGTIGRRSKAISGGNPPSTKIPTGTRAATRKSNAAANTSAFRVPNGQFQTTHGPKKFLCSAGGSCTATYLGTGDNQPAKIVGNISRSGLFRGYWVEVDSNQKCTSKKYGSHFWGRWHARFDRQRASYVGTWSYCDAAPTSGMSGKK